MTHPTMRLTLYPTALVTAACVIVLQSPTAASTEAASASQLRGNALSATTVNSLAETNTIAPSDLANAKGDVALPQSTSRSIPQIEFGAPLDSIAWDTAQPQTIQPETPEGGEAIAPPEVINQPQFSSHSDSLATVATAPPSIEVLTSQADSAPPQPSADPLTQPQPQPTEPTELVEAERFGTRGQRYLYVQGGGAVSFDRDDESFAGMGLAGVGITDFFANGHSINLELNGLGFIQPGEDALGLNLGLLLRWHFLRQEDFSLYVDGGAGLLGTTSEVPEDGSQFNFTPQVGIGATFPVRDENQLMVGLRWHHISNANLYDSNPGRDSILLYFGLSRPR